MDDFYLLNLWDDKNPIPAREIFGNETKKLYDSCVVVMRSAFMAYDGCYRSPLRPNFAKMKEIAAMEGKTFFEVLKEWEQKNPEEIKKEDESRKEWQDNVDKHFRIIYGIAKRHHVYLR